MSDQSLPGLTETDVPEQDDEVQRVQTDPRFQAMAPKDQRLFMSNYLDSRKDFSGLAVVERQRVKNAYYQKYADPSTIPQPGYGYGQAMSKAYKTTPTAPPTSGLLSRSAPVKPVGPGLLANVPVAPPSAIPPPGAGPGQHMYPSPPRLTPLEQRSLALQYQYRDLFGNSAPSLPTTIPPALPDLIPTPKNATPEQVHIVNDLNRRARANQVSEGGIFGTWRLGARAIASALKGNTAAGDVGPVEMARRNLPFTQQVATEDPNFIRAMMPSLAYGLDTAPHKGVKGAVAGAMRAGVGLAEPENLGWMAAMMLAPELGIPGRIASLAATGFFGTQMARGAYEGINQYHQTGDTQALGEGLASGLFGTLAARHGYAEGTQALRDYNAANPNAPAAKAFSPAERAAMSKSARVPALRTMRPTGTAPAPNELGHPFRPLNELRAPFRGGGSGDESPRFSNPAKPGAPVPLSAPALPGTVTIGQEAGPLLTREAETARNVGNIRPYETPETPEFEPTHTLQTAKGPVPFLADADQAPGAKTLTGTLESGKPTKASVKRLTPVPERTSPLVTPPSEPSPLAPSALGAFTPPEPSGAPSTERPQYYGRRAGQPTPMPVLRDFGGPYVLVQNPDGTREYLPKDNVQAPPGWTPAQKKQAPPLPGSLAVLQNLFKNIKMEPYTLKGPDGVSPRDTQGNLVKNGWHMTLPNGAHAWIETPATINLNSESLKAGYGKTRLGPGEFIRGATEPWQQTPGGPRSTWRIYGPDASSAGIGGIIKLAQAPMGEGLGGGWDATTAYHEAVHLARMLGLFTDSEWNTLVTHHAAGIEDPHLQEEAVARAAEKYGRAGTPDTLLGKLQVFFKGLLDHVTGNKMYDPTDPIFKDLVAGKFWSRPAQAAFGDQLGMAKAQLTRLGREIQTSTRPLKQGDEPNVSTLGDLFGHGKRVIMVPTFGDRAKIGWYHNPETGVTHLMRGGPDYGLQTGMHGVGTWAHSGGSTGEQYLERIAQIAASGHFPLGVVLAQHPNAVLSTEDAHAIIGKELAAQQLRGDFDSPGVRLQLSRWIKQVQADLGQNKQFKLNDRTEDFLSKNYGSEVTSFWNDAKNLSMRSRRATAETLLGKNANEIRTDYERGLRQQFRQTNLPYYGEIRDRMTDPRFLGAKVKNNQAVGFLALHPEAKEINQSLGGVKNLRAEHLGIEPHGSYPYPIAGRTQGSPGIPIPIERLYAEYFKREGIVPKEYRNSVYFGLPGKGVPLEELTPDQVAPYLGKGPLNENLAKDVAARSVTPGDLFTERAGYPQREAEVLAGRPAERRGLPARPEVRGGVPPYENRFKLSPRPRGKGGGASAAGGEASGGAEGSGLPSGASPPGGTLEGTGGPGGQASYQLARGGLTPEEEAISRGETLPSAYRRFGQGEPTGRKGESRVRGMGIQGDEGLLPAAGGPGRKRAGRVNNRNVPLPIGERGPEIIRRLNETGLISNDEMRSLIGSNRPEYLDGVIKVMLAQRARLQEGKMGARDLAKAYYMTLSSIQSKGQPLSVVQSKVDFPIPDHVITTPPVGVKDRSTPWVRPEEIAALALHSPMGQRALDALDRGVFDRQAWDYLARVRHIFGTHLIDPHLTPIQPGSEAWNKGKRYNFTNLHELADELGNARDEKGRLDPTLVRQAVNKLPGLGPAKVPFMSHMLGFGGEPTIDAREINAWLTGKGDISGVHTPQANLARDVASQLSGAPGERLREMIRERFSQMSKTDMNIEGLDPDTFAHILHHWIWDKVNGETTTHATVYHALQKAQVGRLERTSGSVPPVKGTQEKTETPSNVRVSGDTAWVKVPGGELPLDLPAHPLDRAARIAQLRATHDRDIPLESLEGGGATPPPAYQVGGKPEDEKQPARPVSRLYKPRAPEPQRQGEATADYTARYQDYQHRLKDYYDARREQKSALQKPEAGALLQRQPGEAGGAGGGRGRVEQGQQGQEAAGSGQRTSGSVAPVKKPGGAGQASTEGRKPQEAVAYPGRTTTVGANLASDAERARMGLPPLQETEKRSIESAFAESQQQGLPHIITQTAKDVLRAPRPMSATETAAVLQRMQFVKDNINTLRSQIGAAVTRGDTAKALLLKNTHDTLETEYDTLDRARQVAGTEWSRAGRARQFELNSYDYQGTMQRMKAADPSKPIPPVVDNAVKVKTDRLQEVNAEIARLTTPSGVGAETGGGAKYALTPAQRLANAKTRTGAAITDLKSRISTGTPRPAPTAPLQEDANLRRLRYEKAKLEFELNTMVGGRQPQNVLDKMNRWQRFNLLTGVPTLLKLTAAAAGRIIVSPIEEAMGGALGHLPVVKDIAAKAPREGGFNASAEWKAIRDLWSAGLGKDILSKFAHGHGSLDVLYGKPETFPHHWLLDAAGGVHGALKTPAFRNEFLRSYEKRLAYARDTLNLSVTDPDVMFTTAMDAYNDARRAILMGNNPVVSGYRQVQGGLKRSGPIGAGAASLMTTFFPIVRVPTNYAFEAANYIGGALSAASQVRRAGGIANLTPEMADTAMRGIKKQGLGLALAAAGAVLYQSGALKIGGYYTPDQKKGERPGEGDLHLTGGTDAPVRYGDIELFGKRVPHLLLHHPLFETLQFGASMFRGYKNARDSGDSLVGGLGAGAYRGVYGGLTQIPFAQEALRSGQATESPTAVGKKLGDVARGIVVPQALQQAAAYQDTPDAHLMDFLSGLHGTTARAPAGFRETIQAGVPKGLGIPSRQDLPVKSSGGGRGIPGMPKLPSLPPLPRLPGG